MTFKISPLLVLVASIALFASCKKEPVACMQYDTTNLFDSVRVNAPIFFTSCSKDESRLEWNFGNGKKFTNPEVAFSFETPGIQTVTLTVWNDNDNNTAQASQTILVYP